MQLQSTQEKEIDFVFNTKLTDFYRNRRKMRKKEESLCSLRDYLDNKILSRRAYFYWLFSLLSLLFFHFPLSCF
jgi:hypothetical protein